MGVEEALQHGEEVLLPVVGWHVCNGGSEGADLLSSELCIAVLVTADPGKDSIGRARVEEFGATDVGGTGRG